MMSNLPKLRFREFSDDLLEKQIGDIYTDLKTGSTPSRLVKDYLLEKIYGLQVVS